MLTFGPKSSITATSSTAAAAAAAVPVTILPAWLSIIIWMSLGIGMILFNKVLLTTWQFHYPFLLMVLHMSISTVFTQILVRTSSLLPGVNQGRVNIRDYFFRILPMAAFNAIGLVLGNSAYKWISLSYIQMIKACTPIPLLILSIITGSEKQSLALFIIVSTVSFGIILSSVGELHFSLIGFMIQFTAIISDSFRMIIMELFMKDLKLDTLSLLYYTAPTTVVLISIGFYFMESSIFDYTILFNSQFCLIIFCNCCLAFILNIAAIHLLSSTSAMVIGISGPLKDMMLVFISFILFRDPITSIQLLGFSISLIGLYLYRAYKNDPNSVYDAPYELLQTVIWVLQSINQYIISWIHQYRSNSSSSSSSSTSRNSSIDDKKLKQNQNDDDDERRDDIVDDEAGRPLIEVTSNRKA